MSVVYDLIVVGAGPAGSSAASAASARGLSTLLVDRAEFPRYKTCGGGLIGPSLASLPPRPELPIEQEVKAVSFTLRGGAGRTWRSSVPILALTNRSDFDNYLLEGAKAAGAVVAMNSRVTEIDESESDVRVLTTTGTYRARYVIGADGSASRVAKLVGMRAQNTDLGLEVELESTLEMDDLWLSRIHLDWGQLPGSYAWVFPKRRTLTVGVIAKVGSGSAAKTYLAKFIHDRGLSHLSVIESSGHLTRTREATSPLGRGRLLLAGDAAGLLEPWTREGISFAVRSGQMAGATVADAGAQAIDRVQRDYTRRVDQALMPEVRAGLACLQAFERRPALIHLAMTQNPLGWKTFCRITTGDTTLARAMEHRAFRALVKTVGAG